MRLRKRGKDGERLQIEHCCGCCWGTALCDGAGATLASRSCHCTEDRILWSLEFRLGLFSRASRFFGFRGFGIEIEIQKITRSIGGYVFDCFLWPSTETGRRTLKLTLAWPARRSPKPTQSWRRERDGTSWRSAAESGLRGALGQITRRGPKATKPWKLA